MAAVSRLPSAGVSEPAFFRSPNLRPSGVPIPVALGPFQQSPSPAQQVMKRTWLNDHSRTERGRRENVWFSRWPGMVTFGEVAVTSSAVAEQSVPG